MPRERPQKRKRIESTPPTSSPEPRPEREFEMLALEDQAEVAHNIVEDMPPPPKKPDRGYTKPEVVIGVDWGTTWTGVAWAMVNDRTPKENIKINVIQQWSGAGSRTSDKVPTEFIYAEDGKWQTMKWGFQARAPGLPQDPIRWTKLLLDKKYLECIPELVKQVDDRIPCPKPAVDLVADYLSALKAHILETFISKYGATFWKRLKVRYIFTVPAIWSHKAKDIHLEAIEKAGYGSRQDIMLISEPEAAAIAAFRSLGHGPLRRYDCFTVVDCGGGTVDLISYKVMNFWPQVEFREITAGVGGACGSVFVNKAFTNYLIDKIGLKSYKAISPKSMSRMMTDFEDIKYAFSDEDDQEIFTVTAIGLSEIAQKRAGVDEEGFLTLTRDVVRQMFDPTITSILTHISNQIRDAKARDQRVKMILLVGGFGRSPYLLRRVREWVVTEGHHIEVLQPPEAWTAIARGAVMHGLENQIVKHRIARRSYGVCIDAVYERGVHSADAKYWDDCDNIFRARDQMEWFIRKGIQISDGKKKVFRLPYTQHLTPDEFANPKYLNAKDTLYACDSDDAPNEPTRNENKWKSKSKLDGTSFYYIEFELVMEVEGEKMVFGLELDEVRYSSVSTKFR
ncbi:hypothetical protein TWF696_005136 [Orbilia brochopaga]|uniref:Actin-like ATPase domain-containing protein n=1 Tax=Orbilia brochopaga TaxID=3140254 RepID=A0AAV9V6E1_9PEZI